MTKPTTRLPFSAFPKKILSRLCLQILIMCALGCSIEGRPRTLKRCGRTNSQMGRIVGGKDVQPGQYPWQVSIQMYDYTGKFQHICGGAILNEHYIVTAAHCIESPTNPWLYEIYTGLHRRSKKSHKPAKKYIISKAIVHEDYDSTENGTWEYDIALLHTKEPINFEDASGYVNGICLPQNNEDPTGWAIVTGWGDMKGGIDSKSDLLQAVKVPLVPFEHCFEAYQENTTIVDTQICAGIVNRDSCQGDSGGPLVQKNKRGIYTLIGVVSFGFGCAQREYPGVYTKVASYMEWMEENMD